jgi:hypothetical protein
MTRPADAIMELPMDTLSKFLAPAILLLLTLAFGVWLSLSGKPYNAILFNIHKLATLAAVVVLVIQLYRLLKGTPIQVPPIVLIILAGLCVLLLFFSGAMMSTGKLDYSMILSIHRKAIILLVIEVAGSIYLFIGRKI